MDFHPMPRYLMRKHAIMRIMKKYSYENMDLLEIGYGAGEIFNSYLKLGINCHGYDFSEDAYNYVNGKKELCGKVTLLKSEPEIEKGFFDIVVACEVLEHIEDDLQALENWNFYLKDNGFLLISVPAHQKRWDCSDIYSGHYRRYEKESLNKLLIKAGFRPHLFYSYDFPSCILLDPIRSKRAERLHSTPANMELSKEELTKVSGIKRDQNKLFRIFSNKKLLYPLIKFQELFYHLDWGSAYIVLCQKVTR